MKNTTLLISLLVLCSIVAAQPYYVATDGNDNNPGTKEKPWATWDKAFETATSPGDTTYFRGGVYHTTLQHGEKDGINGTNERPVCFFNYPGETPVLDCSEKTKPSGGVTFYNANHVKLKGLTVRNNKQLVDGSANSYGIYFYRSPHVTIENCTVHDIGYRGFYFFNVDTLFVINCDAYNVVDSLSAAPGNAGDGFIVSGLADSDTTDYTVFKGCRAWHVSDDGWDIHTNGYIELNNCWAFDCGGYEKYAWGNGYKLDLSVRLPRHMVSRKVVNCIAAYNRGSGFTTNDTKSFPMPMEVFNNTSAFNGLYGSSGHGFTILNSSGTDEEELRRVFRNNVAYKNTTSDINHTSSALFTHSHNTWNTSNETLTDDDFISIDTTGISGPRKADGSLPDLDFMKHHGEAKIVDRGINVGLPYHGDAPDIGFHEHPREDVPEVPQSSYKITKSFPNPTADLFAIEYTAEKAGTITVNVYDEAEEIQLTENHTARIGKNKIVLNLSALPLGNYLVKLGVGSDNTNTKVSKLKYILEE
ncbi:hypothetical protein E9993_08980 [Labilibacter sediminis]|nr:hypothetical protein E9993_08980 [Labilibacter sediminis]